MFYEIEEVIVDPVVVNVTIEVKMAKYDGQWEVADWRLDSQTAIDENGVNIKTDKNTDILIYKAIENWLEKNSGRLHRDFKAIIEEEKAIYKQEKLDMAREKCD